MFWKCSSNNNVYEIAWPWQNQIDIGRYDLAFYMWYQHVTHARENPTHTSKAVNIQNQNIHHKHLPSFLVNISKVDFIYKFPM